MRASLTILALAVYATSSSAFISEMFKCIDPAAKCCDQLSTSGIGVNCVPAMNVTVKKIKANGESTTKADGGAGTEYLSGCHQPLVPACCNSGHSETPPSLQTWACMPAEEIMYHYNSDTQEISSPDDDKTYIVEEIVEHSN